MELKEAKEILIEWVKVDKSSRGIVSTSDFDKFCEEKNIAIEVVLQKLYELEFLNNR